MNNGVVGFRKANKINLAPNRIRHQTKPSPLKVTPNGGDGDERQVVKRRSAPTRLQGIGIGVTAFAFGQPKKSGQLCGFGYWVGCGLV